MNNRQIGWALKRIEGKLREWEVPAVTRVAERDRDPYRVLVSCILSLRTQDRHTREAGERLFRLAAAPGEMVRLEEGAISKTIYPVGFYRVKARQILEISRILLKENGGKVPDTIEELLELPGVGRKTANLVVSIGHGKPGICVDTHVHRITNRWGYVKTKTPRETEFALRERLPGRYWIPFNNLLVTFGQNLCKPISPLCSLCPISEWCRRVSVEKHR